jgi:tetratricopeptide (TPR) repeat protein
MAQTTYMVVDPRQDHSMRIPRPDLSLKLGTPNSCTQCHTDETDIWAANWFRKWYGKKYDTINHFGEVFYSALNYEPEALEGLINIADDKEQPPIVRASALKYMEHYPVMRIVQQLKKHSNDPSPLVRMAAIQTLSQLHGEQSLLYAINLLNDSVRAVRYEAALAYSKVPYIQKSGRIETSHQESLKEYLQMLLVNNDQAATYVNMGIYYLNENKADSAMICYENALKIDSTSVEASINIADIYRIRKQDNIGEKVLQSSLKLNPDRPELYHALGLLYTRKGQTEKALEMFHRSVVLEPENTYYIYILGVALNSLSNSLEAIQVLEKGYEINPLDYNILYLLSAIYSDLGDMENFHKYYEPMVRLQKGLN